VGVRLNAPFVLSMIFMRLTPLSIAIVVGRCSIVDEAVPADIRMSPQIDPESPEFTPE
jgi:hypothetical protein